MNGVDRTKFDPKAAAPYKGRQVLWHGQTGSFREDLQGNLAWTPDSGANLGSNGIEDITGKLGVATGQARGEQYQYDPATGGVTHVGAAPPPPPPPGTGEAQPPPGTGEVQPPGPSFPSEEAKSQTAMFSAAFGSSQGDPDFNVEFDYNKDGTINYDDQLQFGASFAPPAPVETAATGWDNYLTNIGSHANSPVYSKHSEGYRKTLENRSEAPANYEQDYRKYVIGMESHANPALSRILTDPDKTWNNKNLDAVANAIRYGSLTMGQINAIPNSILDENKRNHILKVVLPKILKTGNPTPTTDPDLQALWDEEIKDRALRTKTTVDQWRDVPDSMGDPSGLETDQELGVSGDPSVDPLKDVITRMSGIMSLEGGRAQDDDFYRDKLTLEGYSPDQVERIIRESRAGVTDQDNIEQSIFTQIQSGTFDETATRAELEAAGMTPEGINATISRSKTKYESSKYDDFLAEYSEWRDTELPALAEVYKETGDIGPFTQALAGWEQKRINLIAHLPPGIDTSFITGERAESSWSDLNQETHGIFTDLRQITDPPGTDPPGTDPTVVTDPGFPPGWVDADNDGFDDNTNLDIEGNPRVFTQEGPEQFKATATKPVMPDTDNTINDIVKYLRDASETEDGIDNIAANDLNRLSREAELAQEQLLEDLNRLGLVGLESGDAQAALGAFAGKITAAEEQIRADSDQRIIDNIDKLINVAQIEVSEKEAEARIKELEESIKSSDQRALFKGVMDLLGPNGYNIMGGIFGDGTGPGGVINVPSGLWGVDGLDNTKLSNVIDDDGNIVEGVYQYTNANGDVVQVPENFNIKTDPGAITLRNMGYSDDQILSQMAASKPPKWFDPEKLGQAAQFLVAGELAGEVLGGAAGAIAKGASRGAAIGSVVPIMGTGTGAAIGAGISAVSQALGIGWSGHTDRVIESSWHPAILDVLYQKGFTPRDKVSKGILDEIAKQLDIPYTGTNSIAFRRSSHFKNANVEEQDKIWQKEFREGTISREDLITMSLASSVGNHDINLDTWRKDKKFDLY